MIGQLRQNAHIRKLLSAIGLFGISLTIGVLGFTWIEDMNLIDSIYMTVITISTVGFTEVKQLSPVGRIFTSIYIIFNVALFTYLLSIVSSYFFEGRLNDILKKLRSNMKLNKLENHVIVCGFGRNGRRACLELQQSKKDFIIIEKEEQKAQTISEEMKWYIGDATKDDDLKAIGIERAKALIITTSSDATNVFITLTARNLNPNLIIVARTSSWETQDKLYHAGANHVIMPDVLGGMYMAHIITKPIVIEFLNLINGTAGVDYQLEEIDYEDLKDEYKDKSLEELDIIKKTGAVVIGIKDDVKGIIPAPSGKTVVGKKDHLILLGSSTCIAKFSEIYTKS